MGVPQFKEIRRAYGFDEVAIAPGSVTINPEMTNTDFSVDGITLSTPILGSAMDAVASPKFASTMDGLGGMAVMNLEGVQTRYNNPDDMLDEIVEASEESVTGILQKVYSAPIREELVGERVQEIKNSGAKCAVSVTPANTKRLAPLAAEIDEKNQFRRELWPEMGELGLHGITVEEEWGGLGLGYHIPRMFAQPVIIWAALWASRVIDWPFAKRV